MTTSAINVKTLCEDFINNANTSDLLLRSLTKLSNVLKMFEKFQREIFISLSDRGFNKLLICLKEKNPDIRKLAMKIFIDLLCNNDVLQNIFCEKFNFNPVGNVICLNWLPKSIKDNLKFDEKVLREIKSSTNNFSGRKYWIWPDNPLYTDENIPDPQKYLFGVYYGIKNNLNSLNFGDDIPLNDRIDLNALIIKLENDNEIDEEHKVNYVAAGSGSESSCKMNDYNGLKEKVSNSGNFSNLENSKRGSKNSLTSSINSNNQNKNSVNLLSQNLNPSGKNLANIKTNSKNNLNVNESLSSSLIISNQNSNSKNIVMNNIDKINLHKNLGENSKILREEYKKIAKDKNYSRSIDGNIPKQKYSQYQIINNNIPNEIVQNNNVAKFKMTSSIKNKK